MKNALLVCSEIYPLIKTGGLADFAFSYSRALSEYMEPVVLVPGYGDLLAKLDNAELLCDVEGMNYPTQILSARVPVSDVTLWVVHCPGLFDRPGNPYLDDLGVEYGDSPQRYHHFCRVAVEIALDNLGLSWQPDVVHCNDWHTGLVPAFLSEIDGAPPTVFTIHNLAYQGNYPNHLFEQLGIPWHWQDFEHLEYHGQLSFIKGGLVFADMITTVSPGYAEDIQTDAFGCGLQGLLRHRSESLRGILNGVDYDVWNPGTDPNLASNYDAGSLDDKSGNKLSLQKARGLGQGKSWFAIGFIGRLVHQKGIELLVEAIRANLDKKIQWLIVGTGESYYEDQLRVLSEQYPDRVLVEIGYDEIFAHQVEAAADAFLMPSYYEPCGLNQLYSLKYATVPIVSRTGGLRDSVMHADKEALSLGIATGFQFEVGDREGMLDVIDQAAKKFRNKKVWRQLQLQGMAQDFSWEKSVQQYLAVYREAQQQRLGIAVIADEEAATVGTAPAQATASAL